MSLILGMDTRYLPAFGNNWKRFLAAGILLTLLGLLAIYAAVFTTLISVVILGFIIFFSGAVITFDTFTFWRGKQSGFFLQLIFSILYLLVGLALIINPMAASISLTLLLGVFYIVIGIFRLAFSPTLRAPKWGWGWFNGVITLLLGILIITSWPASGLYIIGLFIGIDLLFCGWSYIMLAIAAKKLRG
jgi:uncharacterized membrane protein HdeD (DUF308 family)